MYRKNYEVALNTLLLRNQRVQNSPKSRFRAGGVKGIKYCCCFFRLSCKGWIRWKYFSYNFSKIIKFPIFWFFSFRLKSFCVIAFQGGVKQLSHRVPAPPFFWCCLAIKYSVFRFFNRPLQKNLWLNDFLKWRYFKTT